MARVVLAGVELIFFIVPSLGQTFVLFWISVEDTVDNPGMCLLLLSSTYTESRPFLVPPHQQGGWGYTRADPSIPKRDIPCHTVSCSAYKAEERRRKGGTLGMKVFIFPSQC